MIVVDISALDNVVGDDGARGSRQGCVEKGHGRSRPDVVDVEAVAMLPKRWMAGSLPVERFAVVVRISTTSTSPATPTLSLTWRAYELHENVTAYEAVYVALAEAGS